MSEPITIKDAIHLPIGQIAALPSEQLYQLLSEATEAANRTKRVKQWIDSAIGIKYQERIIAKRQRLDKETGAINIEDGDYQLTTNIPKKISWDQAKLATALAQLAARGEDPSDYVQVEYKISENNYKAWPQWARDIIDDARTFDKGKPTFKIVPIKKEDA